MFHRFHHNNTNRYHHRTNYLCEWLRFHPYSNQRYPFFQNSQTDTIFHLFVPCNLSAPFHPEHNTNHHRHPYTIDCLAFHGRYHSYHSNNCHYPLKSFAKQQVHHQRQICMKHHQLSVSPCIFLRLLHNNKLYYNLNTIDSYIKHHQLMLYNTHKNKIRQTNFPDQILHWYTWLHFHRSHNSYRQFSQHSSLKRLHFLHSTIFHSTESSYYLSLLLQFLLNHNNSCFRLRPSLIHPCKEYLKWRNNIVFRLLQKDRCTIFHLFHNNMYYRKLYTIHLHKDDHPLLLCTEQKFVFHNHKAETLDLHIKLHSRQSHNKNRLFAQRMKLRVFHF